MQTKNFAFPALSSFHKKSLDFFRDIWYNIIKVLLRQYANVYIFSQIKIKEVFL